MLRAFTSTEMEKFCEYSLTSVTRFFVKPTTQNGSTRAHAKRPLRDERITKFIRARQTLLIWQFMIAVPADPR